MKDNLSIGAIAEIVNKSKRVAHGILNVYKVYDSSEAKKSKGRPRITIIVFIAYENYRI